MEQNKLPEAIRAQISKEAEALAKRYPGNDGVYIGKRNGIEIGYTAAGDKYAREAEILRARADKMEQGFEYAKIRLKALLPADEKQIAFIFEKVTEALAQPAIPQQGAVTEGELIGFAEWAAEIAFFDEEYRLWNLYEEGKMVDGQFRFTTKEFFALYKKGEGGEKEVNNGSK